MKKPMRKKAKREDVVRLPVGVSDDNFNIRLPASEKSAFKDEAKRRGLDATTWARLHLRRAAGLDKE